MSGYKLNIVGSGPHHLFLQEIVIKLGLSDRVSFSLEQINQDLEPFLDQAAVVSPGHVGLSVVQSFWASVPIITYSNANHAPEFLIVTSLQFYFATRTRPAYLKP